MVSKFLLLYTTFWFSLFFLAKSCCPFFIYIWLNIDLVSNSVKSCSILESSDPGLLVSTEFYLPRVSGLCYQHSVWIFLWLKAILVGMATASSQPSLPWKDCDIDLTDDSCKFSSSCPSHTSVCGEFEDVGADWGEEGTMRQQYYTTSFVGQLLVLWEGLSVKARDLPDIAGTKSPPRE